MEDPFSGLREPARKNGLALRAMACYFVMKGALDPVTGQPLAASNSLAFRALDSAGMMSKFTGEVPFSAVVFMSKDSDKKLSRSSVRSGLANAQDVIGQRIETQGIEPKELSRDMDAFIAEVKNACFWGDL